MDTSTAQWAPNLLDNITDGYSKYLRILDNLLKYREGNLVSNRLIPIVCKKQWTIEQLSVTIEYQPITRRIVSCPWIFRRCSSRPVIHQKDLISLKRAVEQRQPGTQVKQCRGKHLTQLSLFFIWYNISCYSLHISSVRNPEWSGINRRVYRKPITRQSLPRQLSPSK